MVGIILTGFELLMLALSLEKNGSVLDVTLLFTQTSTMYITHKPRVILNSGNGIISVSVGRSTAMSALSLKQLDHVLKEPNASFTIREAKGRERKASNQGKARTVEGATLVLCLQMTPRLK